MEYIIYYLKNRRCRKTQEIYVNNLNEVGTTICNLMLKNPEIILLNVKGINENKEFFLMR
jgi:hypothetical protein